MFWIGASLAALLVGLAMLMHEQHAHDVCAASIHGLSRKLLQTPPACGFADTVFWAGMVVFFAGAVSLIAAMWSGVTILSSSFHIKGRPTRRTRIWSSHEPLAPVNHGAGLTPVPPLWLSKLASPLLSRYLPGVKTVIWQGAAGRHRLRRSPTTSILRSTSRSKPIEARCASWRRKAA